MRRLTAIENPPEMPPDAEQRMGAVMVHIAKAMHERLDAAGDLAAHPLHAELRDWAVRLGGCGAGHQPASDRLGVA